MFARYAHGRGTGSGLPSSFGVFCAVLCASAGLLFCAAATGAGWQGKEVVKDGVRYVTSPAEPMEGRREITLKELWRLGAEDDPQGEIFGLVIGAFRDTDGNICLLDSQASELRVYTPAGKFVRALGRRGEGPGEFQMAASACQMPNGAYAVAQTFPGKLVTFNRDGTPGGTIVPTIDATGSAQSFLVVYEVRPAGSNLGIACMNQSFDQKMLRQSHMLGIFDLQGKLISRLLGHDNELDLSAGFTFDEVSYTRFQGRWCDGPDGSIYVVPDFSGYAIHVFDPQGKPSMVISREYQSLKRTPEDKKVIEDIFAGFTRNVPNAKFQVQDMHKDIERIWTTPDGLLWVESSAGRWAVPAGLMGVFDVFDRAGRFVRQVALRGEGDAKRDGVWILGDRVVVVRNLMDAVMAQAGGAPQAAGQDSVEGDEESAEEEPGITIIGYSM